MSNVHNFNKKILGVIPPLSPYTTFDMCSVDIYTCTNVICTFILAWIQVIIITLKLYVYILSTKPGNKLQFTYNELMISI